jgi:hypothetical protein
MVCEPLRGVVAHARFCRHNAVHLAAILHGGVTPAVPRESIYGAICEKTCSAISARARTSIERSPATISTRPTHHWLEVYHVDGFRYDCVPNYWDGPLGVGYANLVYETYQLTKAKIAAGEPYWSRFNAGPGKPLELVQMAERSSKDRRKCCALPIPTALGRTAPSMRRARWLGAKPTRIGKNEAVSAGILLTPMKRSDDRPRR